MALLDIQAMDPARDGKGGGGGGGGGHGGGSNFSLLLCNSTASTLLCL
jgi:Lanthionine-containing peptide SapB precursor RamS